MPQITSIEPQKRKERFNVFLDGAFAFGASRETLLENNLKIGQDLEDTQIKKILKGEQLVKLLNLALNYLSYRQRSEKEVTDYLVGKIVKIENIPQKLARESLLISTIVARLKNYKYLDDLEFAKSWVESRLRSKPRGTRLIKLELLKKGIKGEIIGRVISTNLDEVDLARKAIEKKLKNWQKLTDLEFKKKVYSFLLSRGFTFDTVKKTIAILNQKG